MVLARSLLFSFLVFVLAACASAPPPSASVSPTPGPCAPSVVYPVTFTPNLGGYLATWPSSPDVGSNVPGRLNNQQVPIKGDTTKHDLGNQGPLVATHHFSVHYSLYGATPASGGCDNPTAFWDLDCQDGSSVLAVLWAHSDPCVWDDGSV